MCNHAHSILEVLINNQVNDQEIVNMNEKFIDHSVVVEIVGQLLFLCTNLSVLNILGIGMITFKEENRDKVGKLVRELEEYATKLSNGTITWDAWESMAEEDDMYSDYGGCTNLVNHFFGDCASEELIKSIQFNMSK